MNSKKWYASMALSLLLVLLTASAAQGLAEQAAWAQGSKAVEEQGSPPGLRAPMEAPPVPQPPVMEKDCPHDGGPCDPEGPHVPRRESPDGRWFTPTDTYLADEATVAGPQGTGGPDDYGYTWDDSVSFNWIDATAGIDSGLDGDDDWTGPIDVGFDFKFYENTYSQLYLNTNGQVTFGRGAWQYTNQYIPNPALPNDFIAPFWDDLCVSYGDYNTGRVYYMQGGAAPNRYFVAEWYKVSRLFDNDLLTFEAILYENGDIVMQYQSLSGDLESATVGIEDDVGVDGLQYLHNALGLGNSMAIRFYRPTSPTARIKVWPLYHGQFTRPGESAAFQVPVRNTGDMGSDTYELFPSSAWSLGIFAADGVTPLTDTDSDGAVDTGPLAPGDTSTIVVRITAPSGARLGDNNAAYVTVESSLDYTKSRTVNLQMAIPAPFAQVLRDDADGAMSLYLAQPVAQTMTKVTADWYYGDDLAVAEMPNGFAYLWTKGRSGDSVYVREIEYTLRDRYGSAMRGVSKLTDHSGATIRTYDSELAVAVAPDGRIGVLWYRYLYDYSTGVSRYLYNMYFAVLDSSGNVVVPPTNLTNNTAWYQYSPPVYNAPRFLDPRIAATGDNRFVLAWEREHEESAGDVEDIYYAVRDTSGRVVRPITRFTFDAPGGYEDYEQPNVAQLSGNRVLLTWTQDTDDDVYYAVLNSAGTVVVGATNLSTGYSDDVGGGDAAQLSDGTIVVAWTGWYWEDDRSHIHFAVLDSAYNRVAGPTMLSNPAAVTGDDYVSVAADDAGHAILTWMDEDWAYRPNLYYALVDGNGEQVTPPMSFYTSLASSPNVETSYGGYGNTSYTLKPSVQVTAYPRIAPSYSPATIEWEISGGASVDSTYVAWDTVSHATDNDYAHSTDPQSGSIGAYSDTITLPDSGPVYFKAYAQADDQAVWSSPERAIVVDTYEPNDTWPQAHEITPGTYKSYVGHERDLDWYRLDVTSAQIVTVSLTGLRADYDLVLFTNLYTPTQETDVVGDLDARHHGHALRPRALQQRGLRHTALPPDGRDRAVARHPGL
jgi:hypothetical protein